MIKDSKVRMHCDQWAGLGSPAALLDGPDACLAAVQNMECTDELYKWEWCEGGWLLDFDSKTAIVFGECPLDAFEEAGADMNAPDIKALQRLADGDPVAYFRFVAPKWSGWTLRWDQGGSDAFSVHLQSQKLAAGLRLPQPTKRKHSPPLEFVSSARSSKARKKQRSG